MIFASNPALPFSPLSVHMCVYAYVNVSGHMYMSCLFLHVGSHSPFLDRGPCVAVDDLAWFQEERELIHGFLNVPTVLQLHIYM